MPIDVGRLQAVSKALSDAVAEPELWPHLLDQISKACGGLAAGLLPYSGSQGAMISSGCLEFLHAYVTEGWYEGDRDPRKRAIPIHLRGEVAIDADIVTSDEVRRSDFYNDYLRRFDSKWWAGVGFQGGRSEHWCLALQRSPRQGAFEHADKGILKELTGRLSEIAKLSYLTGRVALSEVANSFDRIQQAVVAVDETGWVIRANESAERLFGDGLRLSNGHLLIEDRKAAQEYHELLNRIRSRIQGRSLGAAPIVVNRKAAPLLIEALPVDGAARSPFLYARALLLLKSISKPARPDWHMLLKTFGLTPAEARLTVRLVTGDSIEQIADELHITRETARYELKSIFRKTDVHRQSELVALLSSLLRPK